MKRKICSFLATLHIMSWVFATGWPFAACKEDTGHIFHSPNAVFAPRQGLENMERVYTYKGLSTLGSRPPNCEHRCKGCKPCNAIQVPATTDHLGVQYANYEPEGWKCKCGSSFFNP